MTSHRVAIRCSYSIEKEWKGHRVVLSRRRCKNKTTDYATGRCHVHRLAR